MKRRCVVDCDAAVFAARSMVRDHASARGFTPKDCAELVIVVSELTSNILKYGVRGTIDVVDVDDLERGAGLRIVATDETAPFNLDLALPDGHDASGKLDPFRLYGRRGIGAGLGAVVRFSDQMQVVPTETGKRIEVTRYVRKSKQR